jgi:phosphoglucomutase
MAASLQKEINALDIFKDVHTTDYETATSSGQLEYVDQMIYDEYDKLLLEHSFNKPEESDLKVIYTPIHGSGLNPVVRLLKKKDYAFNLVDSQSTMDGDFPTVIYPNPEEKEALKLAVELALKKDADIVLGTDPDADRVGVVVKHQGSMHYLNGNEIGVLLLDFILNNRENSKNDYIVKTIVTSDLGDVIAKAKGVGVVNTLTGFKFIGEQIEKFELHDKNFIFGFEESYGYLKDTFVRDKDAVMSSIMIADMAAYYKRKKLTLVDVLNEIYKTYGYYMNALDTLVFDGVEGISLMTSKLKSIKTQYALIAHINPYANLITIEDYTTSQRIDVIKQQYSKILLPSSDVVKFIYSDGSWVVMRPSGTEPKLKIYYQVIGSDFNKCQYILSHMKQTIQNILNS